ncbi:TPA: hypothetical protein JBE16_08765 [Legionella pneumophila subsp. pneumophila]|uniref:hypothetical protein n=1 Tax=Legionella sp. PATHC039 TaxID=2992042 RepID=UPI0012B6A419|nr:MULTISPECIES: hypothetical protein [Legionella]HAT8859285.1 hypothetical protein [Legionella pneumophila subsp. pneumophila]MCW8396581.1 hypothetical protein [Legionella sp. PATHC039]HAT8643183.1 hypothetical protein [Legionella pneumophila]HAT9650899.1 hypothetical protein [Legionella pneumophila subsp. pneumophila]HAT9920291.1 hypothetical protein [Legionella pneumophila subsp. pneumophila]
MAYAAPSAPQQVSKNHKSTSGYNQCFDVLTHHKHQRCMYAKEADHSDETLHLTPPATPSATLPILSLELIILENDTHQLLRWC